MAQVARQIKVSQSDPCKTYSDFQESSWTRARSGSDLAAWANTGDLPLRGRAPGQLALLDNQSHVPGCSGRATDPAHQDPACQTEQYLPMGVIKRSLSAF